MFYNINEFSKQIGVSPNTLRMWDKSGELVPCYKTAGGHRRYSEEQVLEFQHKSDIRITISKNKVQSIDGNISNKKKKLLSDFITKNILEVK